MTDTNVDSAGQSTSRGAPGSCWLEANQVGAIRLRSIAGSAQGADVLTKPLERKRFVVLVEHMLNTVNAVTGEGHTEGQKEELRRA